MVFIRALASVSAVLAVVLGVGTAGPAHANPVCTSRPAAGVDWAGCRKRNLILSRSSLADANLTNTDFTLTDLRNAVLDGANMQKAVLMRTFLNHARLMGANLEKVIGYRTIFEGANLSGSNLGKSELQRADFSNAVLRQVQFSKAELGRTRFNGATIEDTDFSFSNLARADFRGVKMSGRNDFTKAFFYRTRLEGEDLSNAVGLDQSQIDMSCGDAATVLPDGLSTPSSWPCTDE